MGWLQYLPREVKKGSSVNILRKGHLLLKSYQAKYFATWFFFLQILTIFSLLKLKLFYYSWLVSLLQKICLDRMTDDPINSIKIYIKYLRKWYVSWHVAWQNFLIFEFVFSWRLRKDCVFTILRNVWWDILNKAELLLNSANLKQIFGAWILVNLNLLYVTCDLVAVL